MGPVRARAHHVHVAWGRYYTRTCKLKCAPSQSYFSRYNSVNLTVEVVRAAQWHGIALVGRGAATGSDSGVSR